MGGRSGRTRDEGRTRADLRLHALGFPGAWEDFPWGESLALDLPFASPTGYGLARGGWVTAQFGKGEPPPMDLLTRWIEESYRAVALRRLVKELDAREEADS